MNIWFILFALLVALTTAGLLLPLVLGRRTSPLGRAEAELAVHRSRFAQIVEDKKNGLISAEEAADAEAEVGRAILRASREAETAAVTGQPKGGFWPVATVSIFALAVCIAIYAVKGSFGTPDLPLAARDLPATTPTPTLASDHEGTQIQQAIASLRTRVQQNPQNAENWMLLARSYSAVGAHSEAAAAYGKLVELVPLDLEIRGNYAEELIRRDEGFVGPEAVEQFEVVLAHEPKDARARYYLALQHAQAGRDQQAAEGWAGILRDAPPDAPYRPAIRRILDAVIEDAGLDRATLDIPDAPRAPAATERGPTSEDVAAAAEMSEADRESMIRSMVDQLEARLDESPKDVEGWLRLARSRMVLGERDAAIAALERGIEANPDAPALTTALTQIRGAGGE